jgi:5-methylcytosine-specific restriction endonuclease McrA
MTTPTTLVIDLSVITKTKTIEPKEKTIRKKMEEWKFDVKYLEREQQLATLEGVGSIGEELRRQVCAKISGYKCQDVKKGLYDESKFVRFDDVIALMNSRKMACFYCKKQALLFYEYSRDSAQWTLERIDNKHGHNTDNVEIACLNCNLRRRTMYHERYVFTKQMGTVRLLE